MTIQHTIFSIVFFCSCCLSPVFARQSPADISIQEAPFKNQKKSKLMILGSFHFKDAGLDGYKPKFSINIKSEQRQRELNAVLDILVKFKPTRIGIESISNWQPFYDSLYTEFINKRYEPGENEIFQIGYKLAARMGHKQVYTIDVPAREFEPVINLDSFASVHHQEKYTDTLYTKMFYRLYSADDSLKSVKPLRYTLAYQNNPARLQLGMGHYLIGQFKLAADGHYPGADEATAWWNRNLRIFSSILRLATESNEERVFVLIGAGHLQILRFLALSCPEIEFVDAYDYLK